MGGKKKSKGKEPAADADFNLPQSSSSATQPEDPSPAAVHAHTLERRNQAQESFCHMNRIMNDFKSYAGLNASETMTIARADVPRVQQLWGVVLVMEDQRRKNVNSEREKRGKGEPPLELLIPDIFESPFHQLYTAAKELARARRENRAAILNYREVKWLSEVHEYWPRNFVFDTNRKKGGILEPFVRFLKPSECIKNGIKKDFLLPRPSATDPSTIGIDNNEWICQYIFKLTPGTAEANLAAIPDCLNPLIDIEGQKNEEQLLRDYQLLEEDFKELNGGCREFIGEALHDLNLPPPMSRFEVVRVLQVVLMGIKSRIAKNRAFAMRIASLEHTIEDNTKSLETVFFTSSHEFSDLAEKFKDDNLAPKKKLAMISDKLSEMKTRNYSLVRQVEDFKKKLSVFENQTVNDDTRLREKDTIIDNNLVRIHELKEKFNRSERNNTTLENKVEELEQKNTTLEKKVEGLEQKNTTLENKVEGLERKNTTLENKVEDLERKNTAQGEKIGKLERENAASAENSRALEEKVERLEREKAASDEALAKLTATVHVK